MIPLKDIKVKSAKMKRKGGNTIVEAADPNMSNFKRDVSTIMEDLSKKLDKEKPVKPCSH